MTCRLGLSAEALEREFAFEYLPEECRAFPDGSKRRRCIERYRNLLPCWAKPVGLERLACVREVLEIRDLLAERKTCDAQSPEPPPGGDVPLSPRTECMMALREKGFPYITFRFYDLEERAEGLRELGAPLDLVAKFVTAAEQAKQDFNAAKSKDERIATIRLVQAQWRAFVASLSEEVKQKARSQGVGSSY